MEYEDDSLEKQLTRWYRSRTPVLGMLKHLDNDDEFVSHDGSILSFVLRVFSIPRVTKHVLKELPLRLNAWAASHLCCSSISWIGKA